MAEPIAPTVGSVPAGNQPVQTLERQVAPQYQTQTTDYGSAFKALATTPTMLGEIGSKLTVAAASKQADIIGDWLGQSPGGDIIPGITSFDKQVEQSYLSKSNAVLSNQLNTLLNKSMEELNQTMKLNPQNVQAFTQSVQKSAEGILKLAPSSVRSHLEDSFGSTLLAKQHMFNTQLQNESKADTQDQIKVSNSQTGKNAFNNAVAGTIDDKYLATYKNALRMQREAGDITRKEEEAFYADAVSNYYSGTAVRGAVEAKKAQQIAKAQNADGKAQVPVDQPEKYMRNLPDQLLKQLTPSQTISVLDNTNAYMNKINATEHQDNQLILSELKRSRAEGTLNTAQLVTAQQNLEPSEFNDFMTSSYGLNARKNEAQQNITALANNIGNLEAFSRSSTKEKNGAYDELTDRKMQKNPSADKFKVQTGIAKGAPGAIPAYVGMVDSMMLNGDVNTAFRASQAITSIGSNPATEANLLGLSKTASQVNSVFRNLTGANVPADQALEMARKQVMSITEDERKQRELAWGEVYKHDFSTYQDRENAAKSFIGAKNHIFNHDDIPDLPAITNKAMELLHSNFVSTNNYEAAKEQTSKTLSQVYGYSYANGKKQMVYLGIEKMANIGADKLGMAAIHQDATDNLKPQLEATKASYKAGNIPYYYELENTKDGMRMTKIWRSAKGGEGLKEQFNVQLTASPMLTRSNDPMNPVSGYYDVSLIDDKGNLTNFAVASASGAHTFGYRPNVQRLQNHYASLTEERRLSYIAPQTLFDNKEPGTQGFYDIPNSGGNQ